MTTNLVIGSEGFVGKPFCRYLESLGDEVVRFDIKKSVQEDGRYSRLNLEGIDRVYFLAWNVGGSKYLYQSNTQFTQLDWNLSLMQNIFPQLQKKKVPFLFVSSQLAQDIDTVYGITKRLGEVWTRLLGMVVVRLWNVYGPIEEETERSHVVSDFVLQAVTKGEIRMLTDGKEIRQFIHIDDTCRAFHQAINQNVQVVCDVNSGEWISIFNLAENISKLTGCKIVRGNKESRTSDTSPLSSVPGWSAKVSLHEGLTRMVKEVQSRKTEVIHLTHDIL